MVVLGLFGEARGMGLHRVYGWRMVPGVARSGPMWGAERPAATNARGWRDRDHADAPEPGVLRIAVLGDSFTFGVGVDDGERYTDRLEEQHAGVEVLNFGVNGYGTDQQLCVLREEALARGPGVVVCQTYLGNDLEDIQHSFRHRWPKPHFTLEGGDLVEHPPRVSARIWLRSTLYLGEAACVLLERIGRRPGDVVEDVGDPESLYVALVVEMRRMAEAAGADLVVLLVPEHRPDPEQHGRIASALAREGIHCIDLRPTFEGHDGAELFNPPPVAHWNAAGHRLVAEALWRGLVDLDLVDG